MKCKECYSHYARITPLYKPEECLRQHRQYICSTCGRAICTEKGRFRTPRCFMLFKSQEMAMLYVRAAEILSNGTCGVYQIASPISGLINYKIFPTKDAQEALRTYRSDDSRGGINSNPCFLSPKFVPLINGQIRRLNDAEIRTYLAEYQQDNVDRLKLFNLPDVKVWQRQFAIY